MVIVIQITSLGRSEYEIPKFWWNRGSNKFHQDLASVASHLHPAAGKLSGYMSYVQIANMWQRQ